MFIQNLRENSHKIKQNSNWTESARINLPTAVAELFNFELPSLKESETPKIKAVQTVSISLLSATFSCVLRLWYKRCCCDVVFNDVTRDSIACSLTLRHVTENRYVKYPVHNSWRYESFVLTNRIAGKRMNIKKIKLLIHMIHVLSNTLYFPKLFNRVMTLDWF